MNEETNALKYASSISTQMRKGYLAYCLLHICNTAVYTSDIIKRLRDAEMVAVEGTIYPLLSKLQRDGLLEHEWKESKLGAPRKYYKITPFGNEVRQQIMKDVKELNQTIGKLQGESK
jgi:PadR family transcriptional regulator, regulatory protein PadR